MSALGHNLWTWRRVVIMAVFVATVGGAAIHDLESASIDVDSSDNVFSERSLSNDLKSASIDVDSSDNVFSERSLSNDLKSASIEVDRSDNVFSERSLSNDLKSASIDVDSSDNVFSERSLLLQRRDDESVPVNASIQIEADPCMEYLLCRIRNSKQLSTFEMFGQFDFKNGVAELSKECPYNQETDSCDMGECPGDHLDVDVRTVLATIGLIERLCDNLEQFVAGSACWAEPGFRRQLMTCPERFPNTGKGPYSPEIDEMIVCLGLEAEALPACTQEDADLVVAFFDGYLEVVLAARTDAN